MRAAGRRARLAADPEGPALRVARQRYAIRRSLEGNPGAAWHEEQQRIAATAAGATRTIRERTFYAGQHKAHSFSAAASRRLGMNPLTKRESRRLRDSLEMWRRAQFKASVEHTKTGRVDAARLASYYQGRGDQARGDLQEFGRPENPQRAFDPFDYGTPTAAKRARDTFWRELRARGVGARRWTLPGQLEPYAGLGKKGRGIRTVYLVDWQENPRGYPTGPVPARMLAGNPRPGTLPRPWGYLTQEVRLHRSKRYDPATAPQLTSPQEVLQFVKNLPESDRERVFSIYVDQQNRVLGVQPLTVGGTTSSLVPTDALARGALLANATGVILVHNHPSGEPQPSPADKAITEHLTKILPQLDLRLLDHRVVGRGEAPSLKSGQRVPMPNPRRRRARPSRATLCPERVAAKGRFDPRSFRTVRTDGHLVTVGCPKGKYDARRQRCKVGTRAQRILHPPGEATCPLPGREVRRRRRENPPAGPVEIYRRVEFIGATNHQGSRDPGARFLHRFRTRARMLGLPDGSLLIQPAQGR